MAGLLSAALNARGASGTWNVDAAGNWSTTGNWTPAAVPGTAAGDTVGLTFDLTAGRVVTIDTTSRTVGTLNIGDSGSTYFAYTLTNSGGANLTFNNSGSRANLVQAATTASDLITVPITLTDNLSISNNSTLTLSGVISGAKSISKSGTGTLTLSGTNTFTGGMTNLQGIVSVGMLSSANNAQPLGAVASVTLGSSGQNATLQYSGPSVSINLPFLFAAGGTGTFQIDNAGTILTRSGVPMTGGGGLIKSGAGTLQISSIDEYYGNTTVNAGTFRLSANSNPNTTYYLNGGILVNDSGVFNRPVIVGGDGCGLDGIGGRSYSGTLTSSGGNYTLNINTSSVADNVTIAGTVTPGSGLTLLLDVQKGSLILGNSTAFAANAVSLQLESAATLDMNKFNATFGALSGSGTVSDTGGGGGATTVLTLAGTNSATFSGVVANGTKITALVKTNTGTQALSGANTYTGGSTIKGGTILIGVNNVSTTSGALGPSTAAVTLGDSAGSANASVLTSGAFTFANVVTVASGSSGTATLGGNSADDSTFSGNIALSKSATLTSISGGNVTFSGIISGSGFGITKTGAGTVTLSGANTYTGGTTINAGSLRLGANNALASSGAVTLNGGTFSNRGFTNALGALTIQSSSVINLGTNGTAATLTFASGSYTAGTLTVNNWTGTGGQSGTANKIFITAAPSATFLTNITFTGFFAGAMRLGTGEIVPVTALPPTKLAITSVNNGASPTIGIPFSIVVQAQDSSGTPKTVTADTAVTLSLNTGAGTLGGTLTGTIMAGTSSVTISGVIYNQAESGVVLTATRTSGDSLTAGNSSSFTVIVPSPWYNASWTNRLAITIDYTKVSGNQTNFPVLINLTNASLQASALASGNDILFTSVDGTNKLDHEIESYTNSNGALVAWVEVPILSSTTNTIIYLYYGNSSSTNQQNVAGTWNSNFKGVWHFNGVFTDSTSNSFNGVNTGTIAATGKISNGRGYVVSNGADKITVTGEMGSPANVTLSAWVNMLAKDLSGAEFISIGDQTTVRQDNTGVVGFFHDGSTWNLTSSSTNLIGTGWRYVVYTIDDAGNSQKVYVNGVQIASSTFTTSLSYAGQGADTVIGSHANGNTAYDFDGTLDEVRVANAARSAGWVATEYNNQNSPATFFGVGSAESANVAPTKLAITSINGGSNPTASTAFSVIVQAQNAGGALGNVTNDTAVTLSLNTGTGTLGGTLTGTIVAGTNSVTISGVTYSKAESGVILTATRTSGDSLTAGNSSSFTVNGVVTAAQSTVSASPTSVVGNGIAASTITVTLKDVDSSPVAGKTVTLAKSGGSSIISAASGTSSASGVVTFTVTDTVAETTTYTATDTTDSITITQTAAVTFTSIPWYNSSWTSRIAVTIDYTKVSGNQTNFPVLINLTNASLQASALASGNDILFTSVDGTTKLDHEIESYTNSNGALVAWVKVPLLSSTTNTTLYLYYGNASSTNQQNATGVWDANFKGVWHLKEDSAGSGNLSLYRDSTTNNNNADDLIVSTNKSGKIASGQGFNGSSDTIKAANSASLTITQRITLSAWINYTAFAADNGYANIVGKGYDSANEGYYLRTQRSPSGSPNTLMVGSYTGAPSYTDHNTSWTISGWNTNEWHHIVGLYDGSNWKLYCDGVEKSSSVNGTGAKSNARPVTIGAWDNNGTLSRYSNMRIDECRISADSRSAGWVATEYNNQNSPATFASVGSAESAPPTKLAITLVNGGSNPIAGTAFSVVVQAQDAGGTAGNVTTNTAVTLSLNTGTGTLGGTLTGTIVAGTNSVTISGVTYSKAESGVILTATRTSGVSLTAGNSGSFIVNPGALHHFAFAAIGTQTAGSAFNAAMTAQDANNNTVTSFAGTADLSTTAGTISPTVSGTFSAGTRTESVTLTQAGSGKTITATKSGGSETGSSASFTVNPGVIDHYAVSASSPQTAGANFTVTVTAQDVNNNTVTTDSATVVTLTGTGSAQFDSNGNGAFGDNTKTLSSGAFTISTRDTVAQSITLTAMDGNSKTGTSSSITVNPGAIDHYAVSASTPQTMTTNFNTTVTAKDGFNNTVTTDSTTVVTLTGTGSVQFDSNGNGTFGDNTKTLSSGAFTIITKDNVAESITITATDGNSKTGTSASITIQAGSGTAPIDHYVVSALSPQMAGSNFTTTVTAQDSSNNTVTNDSATVVTLTGTGSVQFDSNGDGTFGDNTKILSNGVFTITTKDNVAETIILTATDGNNITGNSSNIVINAGPIDHYATDASTPQTVGTSFNTTVTAKDSFNNTVTLDSSTVVTLTGTGGAQFDSNGNGTFGDNTKTLSNGAFTISTKDNVAETITLTATDGNAKTGTSSSITVNPGNQTITFPSPGNQTNGVAPITLTATASSGMTVSYSVLSGPATVASNILTITGGGSVTIRASQAGDANWNAATPVNQTIMISQAVLFTENFDYPVGELNGQNGGSGFSGAWTAQTAYSEIVNASLVYFVPGGGVINGGTTALQITNNLDPLATRALAYSASGTNVYLSFLIQLESGSIEDNDFAAFWFNNASSASVGIKGNGGAGATTADLMARPRTDVNTGAYQQNLGTGQTHFVVARFSKTGVFPGLYDRATIWVDPSVDPIASPNASFTSVGSANLIGTITSLGLRTVNLDASDKLLFDAITFADNWEDVISALAVARTSNAITSSLNPAFPGSNVTFTAIVSADLPGDGTPTGNVIFRDGTTALSTNALNGSGVAVFSTTALSHGSHTITAEYSGDTNLFGSTNSLTQVINAGPAFVSDTLVRYPHSGTKARIPVLIANDTDADGDSLTLSSVDATSAEGGTVFVTGNWLIYEPPTGFTNGDSFSCVITDGSLTATGSVSITVQVDLAQSQNITAIEDLGNNASRSKFLGIPYRVYTIQYTTNLVTPDWQSLGTSTANASGDFEFTDTPGPGPARFYRSTYP